MANVDIVYTPRITSAKPIAFSLSFNVLIFVYFFANVFKLLLPVLCLSTKRLTAQSKNMFSVTEIVLAFASIWSRVGDEWVVQWVGQ